MKEFLLFGESRTMTRFIRFTICICLALSVSTLSRAQQPDTVKAEEVIDRVSGNATYRSSMPFTRASPGPAMEYAQLGLTIWRLQKGEAITRGVSQQDPEIKLERVEATTQLSVGSNIRLGIEPL